MKNFTLSVLVLLAVFPFMVSADRPEDHRFNIDVTSPATGSVWEVGVVQNIRWVAPGGVETVDVSLIQFVCDEAMEDCDAIDTIILGDDVPNDGLFDFQPRPGFATSSADKYKVEVRHNNYQGENDGYISITNPNNIKMARDITVLTPNTNADVWVVGESKQVKWRTALPGGRVKIALRDVRTGDEKNIAVNVPNTGKFSYSMPDHLANLGELSGQNYKIVVYHLRTGDTVSDASDGTFTINPAI